MYTINSELTSPLPSLHGILPSLHAHFPGGLAEQESRYDRRFHRRHQRQSKKFHEHRRITEDAKWLKALCKKENIPCAEGVAKTFTEVCYHLEKQLKRGYDNVTLDCFFLTEKLERCLSSLSMYIRGIEQTDLFSIKWFYAGSKKYPTKVNFKMAPRLLDMIADQEKNWATIENLQKFYQYQLQKVIHKPSETEPSLLQHKMLDFSSMGGCARSLSEEMCQEENKNNGSFIKNAENITVSDSATPEHPQDRTAMKRTESVATPEPLSETIADVETAKTENAQEKTIQAEQPQAKQNLTTNTPEAHKAFWDKKRAEKQKKRDEERERGYRKLRKPVIEEMIQQAWMYFVSLFQPEGSAPSWVCSELDFKICLSSKIPRLFYGFEGFKKYLDAIFANEYFMGRRRMDNGKFWVLQLDNMLSETRYDEYHKKTGAFREFNYIIFSQKEAPVPQNMLEKLNFSPEQLDTVCAAVNAHLEYSEAILVDKKTLLLTPGQIQHLIAMRPPKAAPIPSESIKDQDNAFLSGKAGEAEGMEKPPVDEALLLGDVLSLFDETVKKHLFKSLPYDTYKAWMIDTQASFEETERGWKVNAESSFSQHQIETRFGQFIDQAQRIYNAQKAEESKGAEQEIRPLPIDRIERPQPPVSRHYSGSFRRILHSFIVLGVLSGWAQAVEIKSCFTPQERCLSLIVEEINQARSEILMQAYSLTSKPISKALREAHDRGVSVKILVDQSQEKNSHSQARLLQESGIEVLVDDAVKIAHNKVIVIDGKTLIGGSYNFSHAAEWKNAENILIVKNDPVVKRYQQNWWHQMKRCRALKKETPSRKKVSEVFREFTEFQKETE